MESGLLIEIPISVFGASWLDELANNLFDMKEAKYAWSRTEDWRFTENRSKLIGLDWPEPNRRKLQEVTETDAYAYTGKNRSDKAENMFKLNPLIYQ